MSKTSRDQKIVESLQRWYSKEARSLPWRTMILEASNDPKRAAKDLKRISEQQQRALYAIWLSEVMLQQTQVTTVMPYFERFLKRFPRVQDLAQASLDGVYELWAGLGYYSRARNLYRGAQAISQRLERGEGFPKNREEWLAIPGVGPYTAGAICSIGLNQREPIVDGNVVRVVARLQKLSELDSKQTAIWKKSSDWVQHPHAVPRALNQALMELGATVCRPKNPECRICPVQSLCRGKKEWQNYPPKKKQPNWVWVQEDRHLWIRVEGARIWVCLRQNQGTRWRQGLWDFMMEPPRTPAKQIGSFELRYQVTRHKVARRHWVWALKKVHKRTSRDQQWWEWTQLPGVPAPVKKAMLELGKLVESDPRASSRDCHKSSHAKASTGRN